MQISLCRHKNVSIWGWTTSSEQRLNIQLLSTLSACHENQAVTKGSQIVGQFCQFSVGHTASVWKARTVDLKGQNLEDGA